MPLTRHEPFLAFSFLLLLLITGSMVIQTAGFIAGISLVKSALFIALVPGIWLTYRIFFPLTRRHAITGALGALALATLSIATRGVIDMSCDGIAYQQPIADAILGGWNPIRSNAALFWQNIYPSGAWAVEASIGALHGDIEAGKTLYLWWLFITFPIVFSALTARLGMLSLLQKALATVMILSATVIVQVMTYYVDGMIYLAGLSFLGALLLHGHSQRYGRMALIIMAGSTLFIVNAKLSGIYHGVVLCAAAVAFLWLERRALPWKAASSLLAAGFIATLVVGYRPYITNFTEYGSGLPMGGDAFSGAQRPANLNDMPGPQRFAYSLFSISGGGPRQPATLKFPWELHETELRTGIPDARSAGFGPLYALGLLGALAIVAVAWVKRLPLTKELLLLAGFCFLSSALFPQAWWLRYVPLMFATPFLMLLALPAGGAWLRGAVGAVLLIFIANGIILGNATVMSYREERGVFDAAIATLAAQPPGSAYLVPPDAEYMKYNHAFSTIQRRLARAGITAEIRVGEPCPHRLANLADFLVCSRAGAKPAP